MSAYENVVPLPSRSGMDVAEYKRRRQELQELYGDPDGKAKTVTAKRDQAYADFFYQTDWTQDRLAEEEGKSQDWVSKRLRFGRFIDHATNKATALFVELTERRFRGYWNNTAKGDERMRFTAVLRAMQENEGRPAPKTGKKKSQPKLDKAREFVRPFVEAGKPIARDEIGAAAGCSNFTVETAALCEEVRLQTLEEIKTAPIDTSILNKSDQQKFAALESRLRAKYEAEFQDRLRESIERHINEVLMPLWGDRLAKADRLAQGGKPFNHAEFRILVRALHPDSANNDGNREAAFSLVMDRDYLLRPAEKARSLSEGLPSTLAELQARRRM